jgi:hypothetical protein
MSGFGVDGDVANGGFEEVAPFGGWGWRYYDDNGVSRPSGGAHSGSHFMRLQSSASTHQNIAAADGETFTVTVWARGASNGDELDISMDFRNQGDGAGTSTPMQTATETKSLTTSWQEFSMTAMAPVGAANPVYHTRVTFTAGAGSVDIDDVVETLGTGPQPSCGDATCDVGENMCNCPSDCGSPPGTEGVCDDGTDNDCDGGTDCDDADCVGVSGGKPSSRHCCGDGVEEGPEGDGRCDGNV